MDYFQSASLTEDSTTYIPLSVQISFFSVLDNQTFVGHLSHLPKVSLLINERADEDCSFSQRLRKGIANKQALGVNKKQFAWHFHTKQFQNCPAV